MYNGKLPIFPFEKGVEYLNFFSIGLTPLTKILYLVSTAGQVFTP